MQIGIPRHHNVVLCFLMRNVLKTYIWMGFSFKLSCLAIPLQWKFREAGQRTGLTGVQEVVELEAEYCEGFCIVDFLLSSNWFEVCVMPQYSHSSLLPHQFPIHSILCFCGQSPFWGATESFITVKVKLWPLPSAKMSSSGREDIFFQTDARLSAFEMEGWIFKLYMDIASAPPPPSTSKHQWG